MAAEQSLFVFGIEYAPPKHGKCLTFSTRIARADGSVKQIGEIVRDRDTTPVVSMNAQYKLCTVRPFDFIESGKRDVYRLTTCRGRVIEATSTHPFYGARGWTALGDLRVGELVATPRELPFFGQQSMPEHEIKALAYHLADGHFSGTNGPCWTNGNVEKITDWERAVLAFPNSRIMRHKNKTTGVMQFSVPKAEKAARGISGYGKFLSAHGLHGKKARDKFIPACIFVLPREQISLFLGCYFSCDGDVAERGGFGFSTASRNLLDGITHLLLRFGIFGGVRERYVGGKVYFEWHTESVDAIQKFNAEIALTGKRQPTLRRAPRSVKSRFDVLPLRHADLAVALRDSGMQSRVSRRLAQELCSAADHELSLLAHSDLLWDEVKSIEHVGVQETFDLTVPGTHNFVANDIIVHNSQNAVMSFPEATFIGEPEAILPLEEDTGWAVQDIRPARNIEDATKLIEVVARERKPKNDKAKKPTIVVVDDLSLLVENAVVELEKKYPTDGRKLYGVLFDHIVSFRDAAAKAGVHVWMNAHLMPPQTKDGVFVHGGPKMPGRNSASIAAKVQTIVKVEVDPSRKDGWPMVYRASPLDKQYYSGDRWGMVYDGAPQNIGELMRARGFDLPRAPGLEWQEEIVEAFAQEILALPIKDLPKALPERKKAYFDMLIENGYDPRHVYWTIRDALDRVRIRRYKANKFSSMLGIGQKAGV